MSAAVVSQKDVNKIIKASVNNINVIIDSLVKNIDKLEDNDNADKLKEKAQFVEEACGVINTYIKTIDSIMSAMPKMNLSNAAAKSNSLALKNSVDLVILFIKLLDSEELNNIDKSMFNRVKDISEVFKNISIIFESIQGMIGKSFIILTLGWAVKIAIKTVVSIAKATEAFNKIDIKDTTQTVDNINKIITDLKTIFWSIVKMIPLSLIVMTLGWLIIPAIFVVIILTKVITKLIAISVSKKDSKNIRQLKEIFDNIYSIMKTIAKMIPVSILAMAGIPLIIAFVLTLITVVLTIHIMTKITDVVDRATKKNIKGIKNVFRAMIITCFAVIALALIAPVAAFAMVMIILPFLVFMTSFFIIMSIAMFLIRKLSVFSRKQMTLIVFNVIMILVLFVIMCLAIAIAAIAGMIVMEEGLIEKIVVGLLAIAAMFTIIIGMGKVIGKSYASLKIVSKAIVPLVQILGYMGAIVAAIIILGGLGYLIVERNLGMYAAAGLTAVAVVMGATMLAAKAIAKSSAFVLKTRALILPLIKVLGLLGLLSLAIIIFGLTGKYIIKNVTNIVAALAAIMVIIKVVLRVAKTISSTRLAPTFEQKVLSLIKVMALLGMVALAIVAFGLVGMFLEQNLGYVIGGLLAIVIVSAIVVGLGMLLSWASPLLTATTAAIIPLLIVLGLFVAAALAIIIFGETAKYLEQNLGYALLGFAAIVIVSAIVVGLGMLLSLAAPLLTATTAAIIPLLIVLGLFVAAALAIVLFAAVGKYLEQNLGYALIGFAAITLVTLAVIGLGVLLSYAIIPLGLGTIGAILLIAVMALLLAVGALIEEFAKTDLTQPKEIALGNIGSIALIAGAMIGLSIVLILAMYPFTIITVVSVLMIASLGLLIAVEALLEEFAEIDLDPLLGKISGNILVIGLVGGELALLGASMVIIAPACVLLIALMTPLLLAITQITIAAKFIKALGDLEINENDIITNINSIGAFWDAFKELMSKFSLKDLLDFPKSVALAAMMLGIAKSIKSIAESIQEISSLKIESEAALAVVNQVFDVVTKIAERLKEILTGDLADSPLFEVPETGLLTLLKEKSPTTKDKLDNVTKIIYTIKNIADALLELEKYKFDENRKELLVNTVNSIFDVVKTLGEKIKDVLENTNVFDNKLVKKSTWWGGVKNVEENVNIDKLDNVSKVCEVLNSIVDTLNKIQKISLNETEITKTVNYLFTFITTLGNLITTNLTTNSAFDNEMLENSSWWDEANGEKERTGTIDKFDNVTQIIESLSSIANALNDIQKLQINESIITNKVTQIFGFIKTLGDLIKNNMYSFKLFDDKTELKYVDGGLFGSGHYEQVVTETNQIAKNVAGYEQVVSSVVNMISAFESLAKLKITEDIKATVNSNLDEIFAFATDLVTRITQFLYYDKNADESQINQSVGYILENNSDKYSDSLETISKLIGSVKELLEHLNKIKEIEFSEAIKTEILNKIDLVFNSTNEIMEKIRTNLESLDTNSIIDVSVLDNIAGSLDTLAQTMNKFKDINLDNFTKAKPVIINFLKDLSSINFGNINVDTATKMLTAAESVLKNSSNVDSESINKKLEFLERLTNIVDKFKINAFEKIRFSITKFITDLSKVKFNKYNDVINVAKMVESIDRLTSKNIDPKKLKNTNDRLTHLERLSKIIQSLANLTPEKVSRSKQLLKDQLNYLSKINSTDITKLRTTANMLASMANLSASIRGNFQGLARSLNEHIAPLLETLKKLLEELNTAVNSLDVSGGRQYTSNGGGSSTTPTNTGNNNNNNGNNGGGAGSNAGIMDWREWSSKNGVTDDNKESKKVDYEQYLESVSSKGNIADVKAVLIDIYQLLAGFDHNINGQAGIVVGKIPGGTT